jgi:mono/diheme cytochrome c family protein
MGHCASCHTVAGDVVIVGPSLDGIATRAETRVPGMDAEGYLLESIIDPNNVTVPGYLPGSMQQNFTTQLTSEELDQIVAYLLTLK